MKRVGVLASIVALLMVGLPIGAAAVHAPSGQAKKKCRIVVKKVHGKKRRVRVCHTVKPKPPALKNVSLNLDTSRSASAAMTVASGGTVSTTASNGLKLTLSVPADALPANSTVTITPVTSIGGVTGKLIAAVQLAPEGLVLAKPATLTIEGANTSGAITGLAWIGSGRYAQRYPVTKSAGRLVLSILHFSGGSAYQGPIGGLPAVRDAQVAFYKNVLLPKLQEAQNSDTAFQQAVELDLTWERGFELIGDKSFMSEEQANAKKLIKQAFLSQVNRAYESCKTNHDVGKQLRNLMAYARQAQGGATLLLQDEAAAKEIEDLANGDATKCGSFQLDFETAITGTATVAEGGGSTWTSHIRVLSLHIQAVGSTIDQVVPPPATQPLDYTAWEYLSYPDVPDPNPCKHLVGNGVRLIDPFSVERLDLTPDDSAVRMDISVGSAAEKVIWQPCGVDGGEASFYNASVYHLHQSELNGAGYEMFRIGGWTVAHGSLYARKTYQQTTSFTVMDVTYTPTETTTLDLRHTPG